MTQRTEITTTSLNWGKLLLLALSVGLFSCSTEPEKKPSNSMDIKVGENDAANVDISTVKLTSRDAFGKTVYALTTKYCASCHSSQTSPLFASDDRDASYDALFESQKINLDDPEKSRIVKRLRDENHNCWGDCQENADEMKAAIEKWIKLAAKDVGISNETDGLRMADASSTSACGGSYFYEAEDATLRNGYTATTLDNVTFVTSANATNGDPNAAGQPVMEFAVKVAKRGLYSVHANIAVPNVNTQDSFFIKVDNGSYQTWHLPQNNDTFTWTKMAAGDDRMTTTFDLSAGDHIIYIRHREPNPRLDAIALTTNTNLESFNPTLKLLCFDVSKQAGVDSGVYFGFAISEFGEGKSYLVSSPVLVTSRDDLHVKNIDILVNGQFHPQYNAYKAIDKTYDSGQHSVSDATIIMTIDKSFAEDRFSVRFGEIGFK